MSLSEALRERGYDPMAVLEELAGDMKVLDRLKLILDCDPRKTTQQGLPREQAASADVQDPPPAAKKPANGEARV